MKNGIGKKSLLTLVAFAVCAGVLNGAPAAERLWPEGVPGSLGNAPADTPEITVHLPADAKDKIAAVVICPGGGYGNLMMSYEGHDIAKWLNRQGIAGVVLKYRIKPYRHPAPLQDAQRAMRTVRARSASLGIDPARVGVMGFSAGGHLASTVGTHFDKSAPDAADPVDRMSCRPDFLILIYPVISMQPELRHGGSMANLLGKDPPAALLKSLSNDQQVTDATPPAFLVHSKTDSVVSSENSAAFAAACRRHKVPVEYLELSSGAHGLGCGKGAAWEAWQAACSAWLQARGLTSR